MKKLTIVFAALAMMVGAADAFAEGFLIKGGLTYSNVASPELRNIGQYISEFNFKGYTGWHAGIGYQTSSVGGFSLQPELLYNVKGTKWEDGSSWKLSYIELPVNVQWGIDLLIARPYIFASPYVGYKLTDKFSAQGRTLPDIEDIEKYVKNFEYGIGVGAGIDFSYFQISAKYSWNFGKILDIENAASAAKSNATGGVEISLAIVF